MMDLKQFSCREDIARPLIVRSDILVRTTSPKDFLFINSLMKMEAKSVGFLSTRTFESYVWGGGRNFMCFLCLVNNDAVGYVLLTPGRGIQTTAKIQQIVIRKDARLLEYGRALVDACVDFCVEFNRSGIQLRCRADLEANKFWQCLGFSLVKVFQKGSKNHMGFTASNDIFEYVHLPARPDWNPDTQILIPGSFSRVVVEEANLSLIHEETE